MIGQSPRQKEWQFLYGNTAWLYLRQKRKIQEYWLTLWLKTTFSPRLYFIRSCQNQKSRHCPRTQLVQFKAPTKLSPNCGRWGTIPMLREQMRRLFSATVAFQYDGKTAE